MPPVAISGNYTRAALGLHVLRLLAVVHLFRLWRWLPILALLLFVTPDVLADSPRVTEFHNTGQFQARMLRSADDLALIELSGNYDREGRDGQPNVEPRTVIAREFYRHHPDQVDFLVVFSTFEFETNAALAFHLGVQNKVKGLGRPEFDNTREFGSAGRLLGYIDMAALTRYVSNPFDAGFDKVLQTFAHEFLHQWGINAHLRAADGSLSRALLSNDSHWNFLLHTGASVAYGNQWRDNGDGSFTSVASRQFFSPLDLYLMGLYTRDEVPPFFLIENADIDPARPPENGVTITGRRRDLTIDDIIAADGPRVPQAGQAQKEFRLGFVLLSRPGEAPSDAQLAAMGHIRKAISTRLVVLSGGRALVQSALVAHAAPATASPNAVAPAFRSSGASMADGLAWLKGRQSGEGAWSDHAMTSLRDTALAFEVVSELDGAGFTGRQRALDWLRAQAPASTDFTARRALVLGRAGAGPAVLPGGQNGDGGWGIAPGYLSNSLDTALALLALRAPSAAGDGKATGAATDFLLKNQNADGGWGNLPGAPSRTAVTTTVLQSLFGHAVPAVLIRGTAFLASRQNSDGGFGDSPSTVHDTANVLLTLLPQNALAQIRSEEALAYLAANQRTDGSWDASVYASALALRLLKNSGIFNWHLTALRSEPAAPVDGQQAVLQVTVANNGSKPAPPGTLRLFDGDPVKTGTPIGTDLAVPGLAPGERVELSLLWNTFGKAGLHTLHAVVDPEGRLNEASKADNAGQLTLTVKAAPEAAVLQVTSADLVASPARPNRLPTAVALSARIANIGRADVAQVRIALREGEGAQAAIIDEKTVRFLGRSAQVLNFSAPLQRPGATRFTVEIDPERLLAGLDRAQTRASLLIETEPALDLAVSELTRDGTPTPVLQGADAVFHASIRNAGTQDSPPFRLRYLVSDGSTSRELASRTLQLAAGASAAQQLVWRSDMAGALRLSVEIDPDGVLADADRSNNAASLPVTVQAVSGANLSVSFRDLRVSPDPPQQGQPLKLTQLVRNTGTQTATNIDTAFFDGEPGAGRIIGGLQKIAALAPGQAIEVEASWPRVPDALERLVFFVIDPQSAQTEITRVDNTAFVTLRPASLPDLAIAAGDMIVTPAVPRPDEAVVLRATLNNFGDQAAAAVLVRLFDGDPAAGGQQIGADMRIATLAARAEQVIEFAIPAAGAHGGRALFVQVDPEQQIEEQREDNNSAQQTLSVQASDFSVSERYFSPNGDGVRDSTSFAFRLSAAVGVSVEVVSRAGKRVRRLGDPSAAPLQHGSMLWDGLDQNGRLAQDGDYLFQVRDAQGRLLGEAMVTLDTNRSSLISAIDTPFGMASNLSCELSDVRWPISMTVTADEERAYAFNWRNWNDQVRLPQTYYRFSLNGGQFVPVLPPELQALGGWQGSFGVSLNGEKFAALRVNESRQINGRFFEQLWVMDGDGRHARMLRERLGGELGNFERDGTLNADGSAVILRLADGSRLLSIPSDTALTETILFDAARFGGAITKLSFSPDRSLALLGLAAGEHQFFLVDLKTGQARPMPAATRTTAASSLGNFEQAQLDWAPDSQTFMLHGKSEGDDSAFFLFDRDFTLRHALRTDVRSDPLIRDCGGCLFRVQTGKIAWAGNGAEFVVNLAYHPGELTDGARFEWHHVLLLADLANEQLLPLEASRLVNQSWEPTYFWTPNERIILRDQGADCRPSEGSTCHDALLLEEGRNIPNLFRSQQDAGMRLQAFLPSGRSLMLMSARAANDPASACRDGSTDQFRFSSLLNLTADLRVIRDAASGGLLLRGSAADQNFARYVLEYAPLSSPDDWRSVMPASDQATVDGLFTTWVPPAYGSYLLRLRVEDKAGNQRMQLQRVSWADTPAITDLAKDREFFSPNGDGIADEVTLTYRVLEPVHLEFTVLDQADQILVSASADYFTTGAEGRFRWDGRDRHGRLAADGVYRIKVQGYEFFVTLDTRMPTAQLRLSDAYGFTTDSNGNRLVIYQPTLSLESDDLNFGSMQLERLPLEWPGASGAAPLELGAYPALAKTHQEVLAPAMLREVQYRLTTTDKAGNRNIATAVMGAQQVFLLQYANHRRNDPPRDAMWAEAFNVPYSDTELLGQIPRLQSISGGNPLRLRFAETVRRPGGRVILQYREVQPGDAALRLADLDALAWNDVVITDFLKPANGAADVDTAGPLPTEDFFEFLWDMQGVKGNTDYQLRIKLVDAAQDVHPSVMPHVFRIQNVLAILAVDNTSQDLLEVAALALWDEPISRIDLLLSSDDDPRYAIEQVVHTVFGAAGNYPHVLGTALLKDLGLQGCRPYRLRLKAQLASGAVRYSQPAPVPQKCFGVDWLAAPETAPSCDATPSGTLQLQLSPYASDGRRLTQLLLGRVDPDGKEQIVNNWNDIRAGGEYPFALTLEQLAAGGNRYFVRVRNEDGKVVTESLRLPLATPQAWAAPASARILFPTENQKVCGIKARNPQDLSSQINVVPVEAAIDAPGMVSWGLEYSSDATQGAWRSVSPAGVDIARTGFAGLRQDPSRLAASVAPPPICAYPDSRLCFDFHPIQWSGSSIERRAHFPGAPARSGELGRLGLLQESVDGELTVRLRVFTDTGRQLCSAPVRFAFDNVARAAASQIDRALFSPNADGRVDTVTLSIAPLEAVTVDLQVLPARRDQQGRVRAGSGVTRQLATGHSLPEGSASFSWDGQTDAGLPAADGLYLLRLRYTDGCGNTLVQEHAVELDTTPPEIALDSPADQAQVGLLVAVSGSIVDRHLASTVVQYALPDQPGLWMTVPAGPTAGASVPGASDLAIWNTLGLSGRLTLRVLAEDSAGNRSEIQRLLTVAETGQLITYLEPADAVFSPNGDRRQDTIAIRYGLQSPARVRMEILRADGSLVRSLVQDAQAPAGAGVRVWDGADGNGQRQADGIYTVRLIATAVAAPFLSQEVATRIALDTTAPAVVLQGPGDAFMLGEQTLAFSVADPHLVSYQLSHNPGGSSNPSDGAWRVLDQGGQQQGAAVVVVAPTATLAEGRQVFRLDATDAAGNTTSVDKRIEIDNTSPNVALLRPGSGAWLSAKAGNNGALLSIAGSVEEKNLAAFRIGYRQGASNGAVDLAAGISLPTPAVQTFWDISAVPDGPYQLWLSATDAAGNAARAEAAVVIDNTAPVAQISRPTEHGYVRQAGNINGTVADTNLAQATLEIAPGAPALANRWTLLGAVAENVNEGVLLHWQTLPVDGVYTLRLKVIDKAGNATEALREIKVDTTAPQVPTGLTATLDKNRDARLQWSASPERDLAGYIVLRDGVRLNPALLSTTNFTDANLPGGNYRYTVKAVDLAEWESPASDGVSLQVNSANPTASIFSPARQGVVSGVVDIRGSVGAGSFREYRLYLGRGEQPAEWTLLRRSPVPVMLDTLASWDSVGSDELLPVTLKLEAEDQQGVIGSDRVSVLVDNTAPAAPLALKASARGADVTLSWSASSSADVTGYLVYRSERIANAQGPVIGSLRPYLIATSNHLDLKAPDGRHVYTVIAMDRADNLSAPSNPVSVTIDTRAPHAVIEQPANGSRFGGPLFVLASSPDTDIASLQFQIRPIGAPAWRAIGAALTRAPYGMDWNPQGLAPGRYELRALATDTGGRTDPAPSSVMLEFADMAPPPTTPVVLPAQLLLEQPTTPTIDASFTLHGRTNANQIVHGGRADNGLALEPVRSADNGSFVFPAIALLPGENRYLFWRVDDDGNPGESVPLRVRRSVPPAAPVGLAVSVSDSIGESGSEGEREINLRWEAANDPDVVAYQVRRIGLDDRQRMSIAGLSSGTPDMLEWRDSLFMNAPWQAADGDPGTSWMADPNQSPRGQWLVLDTEAAGNITQLTLQWAAEGIARDYDLQAWDGEVWVPLAAIRNNTSATVTTTLTTSYLSDRLRILLQDAAGTAPALSEISVDQLSVTPDTSWIDLAQNSEQEYQVLAQNRDGIFSAPAIIVAPRPPTLVPVPPVDLQARAEGSSVRLLWDTPWITNVAWYALLRDDVTIARVAPGGQLQYVDTLLPAGDYRYTIVVTDTAQVSSRASEAVLVTVALPTPETPLPIGPPAAPLLLAPAAANQALFTDQAVIDLHGMAAPGSRVSLLAADGIRDVQTAAAALQSTLVRHTQSIWAFDATQDGARLVLVGTELTVLDLDSGARRVVPGSQGAYLPRWSADGRWLAYLRFDRALGSTRLTLHDEQERSVVPSSDLTYVEAIAPAWSADGTAIALIGQDQNGDSGLWILERMSSAKRLLIRGETWQFTDSPAWSPDGRSIAYVLQDRVRLVSVDDGAIRFEAAGAFSRAPAWSFDGATLFYSLFESDHPPRVAAYVPAIDAHRSLAAAPDDVGRYGPLPMAQQEGAFLAIQDDVAVLFAQDGSVRQALPEISPWRMKTTRSGHIFALTGDQEMVRVALAGSVRFPRVALQEGENVFTASATDNQNRQSPLSQALRITLANSLLPDLAVDAAAWSALPATALVGEAVRLSALVRNAGRIAALPFDARLAVRDAQGRLVATSSRSIAGLAAGASALLTLDWTADAPGSVELLVVLDTDNVVLESVENNNAARRSLTVSSTAAPIMRLSVDVPVIAANGQVKGTASILNAGAQWRGQIRFQIEDAAGFPVQGLAPQEITDLGFGQAADFVVDWNASGILPGQYRLTGELVDANGGRVAQQHADFRIAAVTATANALTASVRSEQARYLLGQGVGLTARLELDGAQSPQANGEAQISVHDGQGVVLFQTRQALALLLPNQPVTLVARWETGQAPPGTYQIRLHVTAGGQSLGSADSQVDLAAPQNLPLAGELHFGQQSIARGERLLVTASLRNPGALAVTGLPVQISIIDPATQAVIALQQAGMDVQAGASARLETHFETAGWPLTTLQVVFASAPGQSQAPQIFQRASLQVQDRLAPELVFLTPGNARLRAPDPTVELRIRDRDSRVLLAEYSLDGKRWQALTPQDPAHHLYVARLAAASLGPLRLQARATDVFGNVSAPASIDLLIESPPAPVIPGLLLTAVPTEVEAGAAVSLLQEIDNAGEAIADVTLTLQVREAVTDQLLFQKTATLPVLPAGASRFVQSWLPPAETGENAAAGTNYRASLLLHIAGQPMAEARTELRVVPAQVRLAVQHVPGRVQKILVLARCPRAIDAHLGLCGRSTPPNEDATQLGQCDFARGKAIEARLDGLGIRHKVVSRPEHFLRELRSGGNAGYTGYWISGVKLGPELVAEIKAGMHLGESLAIDGLPALREADAALVELAGVHHHGRLAGSALMQTLPGLFAPSAMTLPDWQLDVYAFAGATMEAELLTVGVAAGTADRAAEVNTAYRTGMAAPDHDAYRPQAGSSMDAPSCTGHSVATEKAAIISNTFGAGTSLFFAFDWVNAWSSTAATQAADWQALGADSFEWLKPRPVDPADQLVGGDLVTIRSVMRNDGQDLDLAIVAELPPGVKVSQGLPLVEVTTRPEGDLVRWRLKLPAGAQTVLQLHLRLPFQSASHTVRYKIDRVVNGASSLLATETVVLHATDAAKLLILARQEVDQLRVEGDQNLARIALVRQHLARASTAQSAGQHARALRELLMAQSRLAGLQGSDQPADSAGNSVEDSANDSDHIHAQAHRALARSIRALERRQ